MTRKCFQETFEILAIKTECGLCGYSGEIFFSVLWMQSGQIMIKLMDFKAEKDSDNHFSLYSFHYSCITGRIVIP